MRISWLVCVLLGSLAWGQAAPGAPPPAQPAQTPADKEAKPAAPADTSASVPPDAAVITVNGVCSPATKAATGSAAKSASPSAKTETKTSAEDCKTVITKAEFEKLANSVAPNNTVQQRKQLASMLPRIIAFSDEAKKEGLDKTPQYDETIKFVKMQVLTNQLTRKIQEEAGNISQDDIEKYYKEHPDTFEQYNVDRLFIPRTKQVENSEAKEEDEEKLTDEQKKAKEAAEKAKAEEGEQAMTKLANDIRARAAAGEDFIKLQKEAFEAAGMKVDAPSTNLPSVRRTGLPATHAAAFDLKPGEVSQVITDAGGHYIYKLNSKTLMPLDEAKKEIQSKMQNERMRESMDKLNNSFKTETNEAYFGPGGLAPQAPPRMPRAPRPGMPPVNPSGQPQNPPSAQPPAAKPD